MTARRRAAASSAARSRASACPTSVIDEEVGYITDRGGVTTHYGQRVDSLKALLAEGYDAVFVGSGAPRGRELDVPGPRRGGGQYPYRHRLAVLGLLRPYQRGRQARHRAGRRQYRDGLLPLRPPPRRRAGHGRRPLRLRGDEGLARGRRRMRCTRASRSATSWCRRRCCTQDGRLTGMVFEKVQGRVRRQGPPPAGALRRAGRGDRGRRRAGGDRPGERLPLDRARHRPGIRPLGPAVAERGDPSSPPSRTSSSAATPPSGRRTSSGPWRMAMTRRSRSTCSAAARM